MSKYEDFRNKFTEYDRLSYVDSEASPYNLIFGGNTILGFDVQSDNLKYNVVDTMRFYDSGYIELELIPNYDSNELYPLGYSFASDNENSEGYYQNFVLSLELMCSGTSLCKFSEREYRDDISTPEASNISGTFHIEDQPENIKVKLNYSPSGHSVYINDVLVNMNYSEGDASSSLHLSKYADLFNKYEDNNNLFSFPTEGYYGVVKDMIFGSSDELKLSYPLNNRKTYGDEVVVNGDVSITSNQYADYGDSNVQGSYVVDHYGKSLYERDNTPLNYRTTILPKLGMNDLTWSKDPKLDVIDPVENPLSGTSYSDLIPLFDGDELEGIRDRYRRFFTFPNQVLNFNYFDMDAPSDEKYWCKWYWDLTAITIGEEYTREEWNELHPEFDYDKWKDWVIRKEYDMYNKHSRYFEFTFAPTEGHDSTSLGFSHYSQNMAQGHTSWSINVNPSENILTYGTGITMSSPIVIGRSVYNDSIDNEYTLRITFNPSEPYVDITMNGELQTLDYISGSAGMNYVDANIYSELFMDALTGTSYLPFSFGFSNQSVHSDYPRSDYNSVGNVFTGHFGDLKYGTDRLGDIIHFPLKTDGGDRIYEVVDNNDLKFTSVYPNYACPARYRHPLWVMDSSQATILPWAENPFDVDMAINIIKNDPTPDDSRKAMYRYRSNNEIAIRRNEHPDGGFYLYPYWLDITAEELIRNPDCWYQHKDITSFSVMCRYHTFATCITLLSPRHGITANHTRDDFADSKWLNGNTVVPFMDMDNNVENPRNIDFERVGRDLCIMYFDRDVSDAISPVKFLPEGYYTDQEYQNSVFSTEVPYQYTSYGASPSKEGIFSLGELEDLRRIGSMGDNTDVHYWTRFDGTYNLDRTGDSGRPLFALQRDELIFLGCYTAHSGFKYPQGDNSKAVAVGDSITDGLITDIQDTMNILSDRNGDPRYDIQRIKDLPRVGEL